MTDQLPPTQHERDSESKAEPGAGPQRPGFLMMVRLLPVVFSFIGISVLMLPWSLQAGQWESSILRGFAIVDPYLLSGFTVGGQGGPLAGLLDALGRGEFWRPLTPVFLHFDFMHIAFNGAIVYVLGQRLEIRLGTVWMLVFMLISGIASNVVQLLWSGHSYFGGLSGIGFALLGGLIALGWLRPKDPALQLPKQFVGSILVFLVVFSTGLTEAFGLHIANAAHWSGLGTGVLLGLLLHGVLRNDWT